MKIYTKRGDGGETDLFAGGRVQKDTLRVEAYGCVDELNAVLGQALALSRQGETKESKEDIAALCREVQVALFELGSSLATPDPQRRGTHPDASDVEVLERAIDELQKPLPPLRRFILPGGTAAAAAFHQARTVCRRAERRCVSLQRAEGRDEMAVRYLNRLSDLLFVLARVENRRAGCEDIEWEGRK